MKHFKKWLFGVALVMAACFVTQTVVPMTVYADDSTEQTGPVSEIFDNYEDAVDFVREALVNRETTFTVRFTDRSMIYKNMYSDAAAYERGASGPEGDSIALCVAKYYNNP